MTVTTAAADPLRGRNDSTDRPVETDVLVVGGGILGCATACYLAREGVEVVLIDREDVNSYASGRNAGSLHAQLQQVQARNQDPMWTRYFDDALPLYILANKQWQELSQEVDCDIEYRNCGGIMVAETDEQFALIRHKVRRERAKGLRSRVLARDEVRAVAPYLSDNVIGAELCPHEGKVNPALATPAVARAAERAGARLMRWTELRSLEGTNRGFTARTNRGPIQARRVVNAAGPWSDRVAAMVGLTFPITRSPIHMNVTEPTAPLIGHLVLHAGRRLSMKQAANGNVLIGGGWPARFVPGSDHPRVMRSSIEGSLWVAQAVVPRVSQLRLLRTWTGVNLLVDGKPLLGGVPRLPGYFNAITSTGFTLGPICGRLTAEVMAGRKPSFDITPYTIDRLEGGPTDRGRVADPARD